MKWHNVSINDIKQGCRIRENGNELYVFRNEPCLTGKYIDLVVKLYDPDSVFHRPVRKRFLPSEHVETWCFDDGSIMINDKSLKAVI